MTHYEDPEDDFYASGNIRDMRGHNGGPPLEAEDLEVPNLNGLSLEEQLAVARQILLEKLIRGLATGTATPQEMNTLRQLLKDNGMVMGDPFAAEEGERRVENNKADLPSFDPPEYVG